MSLVSKIISGRSMLYVKELVGQGSKFSEVKAALQERGIAAKIVETKKGSHVIHLPQQQYSYAIGKFPGGVITPFGKASVSLKFGKDGNLLQMVAVQKSQGATGHITGASIVRTADGVEALEKAGVKAPSNYFQIYKTNGKTLYTNKTEQLFNETTPEGRMMLDVKSSKPAVQTAETPTQASGSGFAQFWAKNRGAATPKANGSIAAAELFGASEGAKAGEKAAQEIFGASSKMSEGETVARDIFGHPIKTEAQIAAEEADALNSLKDFDSPLESLGSGDSFGEHLKNGAKPYESETIASAFERDARCEIRGKYGDSADVDEILEASRKGTFGQDIYDPLDPRNKEDILSPFYESPSYNADPYNPYSNPYDPTNDIIGGMFASGMF